MSRPLLEETVRARVGGVANVTLRAGVRVDGLAWAGREVVGVRLQGNDPDTRADGTVVLDADLVVDCTGRSSRLVPELADAGFPEIPVEHIEIGISYGTKVLSRNPGDLPFDAPYAVFAASPPHEPRSAVLLPIEGDRWILTLAGMHGDNVPVDDEGFHAFAEGLPHRSIADLITRAECLSPVASYRYPSSQRRRFERVAAHPVGYVALGDAVCSFNPIYGQGMSSAALQAVALARSVERSGARASRLPNRYYRAAAKVVDNPWQIAAGGDFAHPATTGAKPPGTDLVNRYVHRVQQATHVSPKALERMLDVQSLVRPPTVLMRPIFAARVLAASRRHARADVTTPRWHGDGGPSPTGDTATARAVGQGALG